MNKEFDPNEWNKIALKLQEAYPQLTNADLIWRHDTKADFYKIIASKLEMSMKKLEYIISTL